MKRGAQYGRLPFSLWRKQEHFSENGMTVCQAVVSAPLTKSSNSARSGKATLLVPDKDADGLSSGVILRRTLTTLGLPTNLISTHIVTKGSSIHDPSERDLMSTTYKPSYVIVLDQGSRAGPPLIDNPSTESLILDHHLSDAFPENAVVVSACHYPPVATTSLLTYLICAPLHPSPTLFEETCAYLACIGTHGDLGNTLKWLPPFPDLTPTLKQHTKKAINDAVSLVNAPRRTARYDVLSAWSALLASTSPKDLLTNPRLLEARAEINEEVERHTHTPPKFTPDGRIAVLRIHTPAQVHPVIATRWAGYLNSKALEIVMVANSGYLPGVVNFSCRVARCARARAAEGEGKDVNIIESLKAAAGLSTDGLGERLGESFARGHREASGGIVPVAAFEELMGLLRVGEKVEREKDEAPKKKRGKMVGNGSPQKNNLGNYFQKA